jgi:hypothetical protein
VYGSLTALNHGIYHPSKYAEKTDAQWLEISEKIIEDHGTLIEDIVDGVDEVKEL